MPKKVIAGFMLLMLLFFSARHLMFKHYLSFQKNRFRVELFNSANSNVFKIRIDASSLYKNINGMEWKDKNKEIIIRGLYHEVLHVAIHHGVAEISLIEDTFENTLIASFYSTLAKEDPVHSLFSDLLNLKFIDTEKKITFHPSFQIIRHLPESYPGMHVQHASGIFIPPKS